MDYPNHRVIIYIDVHAHPRIGQKRPYLSMNVVRAGTLGWMPQPHVPRPRFITPFLIFLFSPISPIALKWFAFALYIPMFFQLLFKAIRLQKYFVFLEKNPTRPDFRSFISLMLLGSILVFVSVPPDVEARAHFGAWTVLLAWIEVLIQTGNSPTKFGLFVNILRLVFLDILTFFLAIFPLLVRHLNMLKLPW